MEEQPWDMPTFPEREDLEELKERSTGCPN